MHLFDCTCDMMWCVVPSVSSLIGQEIQEAKSRLLAAD
jgi:hypothetical protein